MSERKPLKTAPTEQVDPRGAPIGHAVASDTSSPTSSAARNTGPGGASNGIPPQSVNTQISDVIDAVGDAFSTGVNHLSSLFGQLQASLQTPPHNNINTNTANTAATNTADATTTPSTVARRGSATKEADSAAAGSTGGVRADRSRSPMTSFPVLSSPPHSSPLLSSPPLPSPPLVSTDLSSPPEALVKPFLVPLHPEGEYRRRWIVLSDDREMGLRQLKAEYASFIEQAKSWTHIDPAVANEFDAIERDVPRTFAATDLVDSPTAQDRLRRLLAAYALADKKVGYVQALNFIAAFILAYIPDDAEAYALFSRMMKSKLYHMRDCFLQELPDVEINSYIIKRLLWQYLPRLAEHLERVGVDPIFWFEWYFTLFTLVLPRPLCAEVWTWFLEDGWLAVFKVILALLEYVEPFCLGQDFQKTLVVMKGYQQFKMLLELPVVRGEVAGEIRGSNAAARDAEESATESTSTTSATGLLPAVADIATGVTDIASAALSSFTSFTSSMGLSLGAGASVPQKADTPSPNSLSVGPSYIPVTGRDAEHVKVLRAFSNSQVQTPVPTPKPSPAHQHGATEQPIYPARLPATAGTASSNPPATSATTLMIDDQFVIAPPLDLIARAKAFSVTTSVIEEYRAIAKKEQARNKALKEEEEQLKVALEASKKDETLSKEDEQLQAALEASKKDDTLSKEDEQLKAALEASLVDADGAGVVSST